MTQNPLSQISRRALLARIGTVAGSSVMYQAMTSLGLATESTYQGPIKLEGDPKGASVLILGAGLAGMVAALELRNAGYRVQVLEYNERAGGRCWSLRGGDRYTELGGAEQVCEFDKELYFNPGPWRIPYHHRGVLDYCRRLGVELEPFIQVNHNAYLHAERAFGGKPQRFRHVLSDFNGSVAELLAKAVGQDKLDQPVSAEDKALLLEALRQWGALDDNDRYATNALTSTRRGYDKEAGGGLNAEPIHSHPAGLSDILNSRLWVQLAIGNIYQLQSPLFQPAGGMDMIAKAFEREVGTLIRYNAKVTAVNQDGRGVTVTYVDARKRGAPMTASADLCLCTIPLSVLSQIDMNVSKSMKSAIDAVPYGAAIKVGLQFRRRFWEQDEEIYGGITYTDLPISEISYPCSHYGSSGKGVVLGAYAFGGPFAYEFTALSPADRLRRTVEYGTKIHPQYATEYETGVSVAWHRVPWTLGCYGQWGGGARDQHYRNLCGIDGRIALAGEHASYIPGWQEGAVLSALDAISRLHQGIMAGAFSP